MALHIKIGSSVPGTIPTEVGQHFIDIVNGNAYTSIGTNAPTDWKQTNNAGSGATTFLDLTDTPVNYLGAAGQLLAVAAGEAIAC